MDLLDGLGYYPWPLYSATPLGYSDGILGLGYSQVRPRHHSLLAFQERRTPLRLDQTRISTFNFAHCVSNLNMQWPIPGIDK